MILGRRSGEPRSWSTIQVCRDLKMNMQLLSYNLGTSIMLTTTKMLLGTTSILTDSMMMLWRHLGDGVLSRMVETWNLIYSFIDVLFVHPPCQKQPRLLSGTTSVLLDSTMMIWRHIGNGAFPGQVEIFKFICSFLDVILERSTISKTTKTPLRIFQRPLRFQGWHLDDSLENQPPASS